MTNLCAATPPLVSVVMTVLNPHPRYFPQAVQSILDQTLEEFELVIIEDPSPRNGQELLAAFNDPRIRHVVNPRRTGLIQQRNQGLAEARADLVAIMDADDIAEPTRLRKQLEYLQTHPDIGVVGSQICAVDANDVGRGYRCFPLSHEAVLEAMPQVVPLCHPSVMYRKTLVLEAGGYQYFVEDYELWSRLVNHGVRIANHPEVLLRYRIHPEMSKVTQLRDIIRGVLSIKNRYWRDKMGFKGKVRMWAERLLLWLPPWLAFRLIMLGLYRDRMPVDHSPALYFYPVQEEKVAVNGSSPSW